MWASVKRCLPPKCHATRIENRHGGGIPDLHIAVEGASFWIELKSDKHSKPTLRPQQAAWHLRQASCGGLSYVLCGCARSPYVKIWRASEASLRASAGLLCVPTLIECDDMGEALRLLFADALRLVAEGSLAASRSAASRTEKTPDT